MRTGNVEGSETAESAEYHLRSLLSLSPPRL